MDASDPYVLPSQEFDGPYFYPKSASKFANVPAMKTMKHLSEGWYTDPMLQLLLLGGSFLLITNYLSNRL